MLEILSIAAFLSAILCMYLGAYAYSIDRFRSANKLFFIICAACSLWALTFMVGNYSADKNINWIAYRVSAIVWCVIPSMAFHFILKMIKIRLPVKSVVFYSLLYLPSVVFIIKTWFSTLLYNDFVRTPYGWIGVAPSGSVWPLLFAVYMAVLLFGGNVLAFIWGFRSPDISIKKQSRIVSFSMIVCVGLSVLTDVLFPILGFVAVPSIGSILSLVWVIGIWYSIVHYRLLITSPSVVFDEIITNIRDLLIFCNPQGLILKVNPEMMMLLNMPEKDILGKSMNDLLEEVPMFEQEVTTGTKLTKELLKIKSQYFDMNQRKRYNCISSANVKIPLTGYTAQINDHSNRVIGSIVIAQDIRPQLLLLREISERTQAQTSLAQARDHLELMVQERTNQLEKANRELRNEIQERKLLEEQFRQAQKMEVIGQLVSGVTHDLNNLLTPIQGYSEFIAKACSIANTQQTTTVDINKFTRWSTEIKTSSKRASDLVQKLLTISRKATPQESAVDVHCVVGEVIPLFSQIINRSITVHKVFTSHHCTIVASQSQLHSAILNLSINARDAMPGGGNLTYTTNIVEERDLPNDLVLPIKQAEQYVQIMVSDTGTGIPDEIKGKIFEPFFTTKELGKGTGLGLASVYRTVANCGGSIQVNSTLGKGTDISLFFPLGCPSAFVAATQSSSPLPQQRKGHVVVVDDEEPIRTMVTEVLLDFGFTVATKCDSKEAIAYFLEHQNEIDLIVTDINMPGMSGRELIEVIRSYKPDQVFLIMTGYGIDEPLRDNPAFATIPSIQKPFDIGTMLSTVQETLLKTLE